MADFDPTTAKPMDFDPSTATPVQPRGMVRAFGAGAGEAAVGAIRGAARIVGATSAEEWAKQKEAGYAPTEEESIPVSLARAAGGMAVQIPAFLAAGALLPEAGAVALAGEGLTGAARLAAMAEARAGLSTANTALRNVAAASPLNALEGANTYADLRDKGVDPKTAATAGVVTAATGSAMMALPVSVPGGMLTRAGSGMAIGLAAGEGQRVAQNAVLNERPDLQSEFSAKNAIVNATVGAALGGIMGHNPMKDSLAQAHTDAMSDIAAGKPLALPNKPELAPGEAPPPSAAQQEVSRAADAHAAAVYQARAAEETRRAAAEKAFQERPLEFTKPEKPELTLAEPGARLSPEPGEAGIPFIESLEATLEPGSKDMTVQAKKLADLAATVKEEGSPKLPKQYIAQLSRGGATTVGELAQRAHDLGLKLDIGGKDSDIAHAGTLYKMADYLGWKLPEQAEAVHVQPPKIIEGEQHAIQEPSAGGVLQHTQEGVATAGGERGRMEPGIEGEKIPLIDQRAIVEPAGTPRERRATAPEIRAKFEAMTPEQRLEALETLHQEQRTNPLSGLPNKRAYEESEKLPVQVFADIDNLKKINDTQGHAAGDAAIKAMGQAIAKHTTEAYHISGDEFHIQAKTVGEARRVMNAARDAFKAETGHGFSYGHGKDIAAAEKKAQEDKEIRKKAGLRTEREEPVQAKVISKAAQEERRIWKVQAGSTIMAEVRKSAGLGKNIPEGLGENIPGHLGENITKPHTSDNKFEAELQAARDAYGQEGSPGYTPENFRKITEIIERGPHYEKEEPLEAARPGEQIERDQQTRLLQDKFGGTREDAIMRYMRGERIDPETGEVTRQVEHVAYEDDNWKTLQESFGEAKTLGDALKTAREQIPEDKKYDFLRNTLDALIGNKRVSEAGFSLSGKARRTIEGLDVLGNYHPDEHKVELHLGGGMRSLIHEALHAALHSRYETNKGFQRNMDRLFNAAKEKATPEELKQYGFKDTHEFMSEAYADQTFQKFLKRVDYRGMALHERFWTAVKNWVKELIGKEDTNTLFHDVIRATEKPVAGKQPSGKVARGKPLAAERVNYQAGPRQAAEAADAVLSKAAGLWDGVVKPALLRTHLNWASMNHIADVTENIIPRLKSWSEDTVNPIREKVDNLLKSGAMAVKLNHQTRQIVDSMNRLQPKQQEALFALMGKYQLAKVFPNKTLEAHVWLKGKDRGLYREATQLYNQPGVADAYNKARLHNQMLHDSGMAAMLKSMGHIYGVPEDIWSKIDALKGMSAEVKALQDWVAKNGDADLKEQFKMAMAMHEAKKNESYFHIGRDGDFMVRAAIKNTPEAKAALQQALVAAGVKDKIVINPEDLKFFSKFETFNEMLAVTKQMDALAKAGHLQDEYTAGKIVEKLKALDSSAPSFIRGMLAKIDADVNLDAPEKAQQQELLRRLYIDMLPESSVSKYFARRGGTPGYSADMIRSFAKRASGAAYFVAQNATRGEQAAAMARLREATTELGKSGSPHYDPAKQQYATDVLNELNQRTANILTPLNTPTQDKLSSFGHTFFLSASPGFILQNLAQPYQLTLPYLGARHGFRATAVAMGSAGKDALAMMKDAIQEGYKDGKWTGILDATITTARSNMSAADKRAADILISTGRVDFTQAGGLSNVMAGAGEVASTLDRTKQTANFLSQQGEILNRMQTGLAAFRLEMKRNGGDEAKAYEYMTKAVDDTQINYATENRARAIGKHGVFGQVTPLVLAFQQYNMGVIQLLGKLTMQAVQNASPGARAEAVKSLAGIMATTGVVAGTMGLPFAGVVMGAYNAFAGDNDHPVDAKSDYQNFLSDIFGHDAGQIIAHGAANYITGADVAQKLGQEQLLPFTQIAAQLLDSRQALKDRINSGMLQFAGPVVNAGAGITEGMSKMADGDVMKGMEQMFPSALRGVTKAIDVANNGFTDSKGNKLPIEATTWDAVTQAAGFTPTKLSTQREAQQAVSQVQNALKLRAGVLESKFAEAVEAKDATARQQAIGEVMAFNKANPGMPIKLGTIMQRRAKEQAIAGITGVMGRAKQIPLLQQQTRFAASALEFKPQQSLLSQ